MDTSSHRLDTLRLFLLSSLPTAIIMGRVVAEGVLLLAILASIPSLLKTDRKYLLRLATGPIVGASFVWFLTIVISLALNGAGAKGWAHDLAYVRYPLFLFCAADLARRKDLRTPICYGLVAAACWGFVNTAAAHLLGFDLIGHSLGRYTGKLKEAARISALCAFGLPIFTHRILNQWVERQNPKGVWLALLVVSGWLLYMMKIRTSVLAAAVGCLYAFFLIAKRVRLWFVLAAVILTVGCTAAFFHYKGSWDLSSIYDRVYFWNVAGSLWKQKPIFGVGISGFKDAARSMASSGRITPMVFPDGKTHEIHVIGHAHNLFLMLLSTTGLAGFLAFLWMFASAWRKLHERPAEGYGFVVWPVTFLAIGLTGWNIYTSWYLALVIVFISYSLTSHHNTQGIHYE